MQGVGMALAGATAGHWPGGTGTGQTIALPSAHYYCPLPTETLVQAAQGSSQAPGTTDQLVYAAAQAGGPYQTVDLSDSTAHLVAQSSEVVVCVFDSFSWLYRT